MKYQRFVLVSHLRSGTHMLRSSLESHPAIVCQSEVFNSDNRDLPYPLSTPAREILDRWVYGDLPATTRCAGFVIHSYQPWGLCLVPQLRQNPKWASVWTILAEMDDLKVLHLKRANLLRRHLSHIMARRTAIWHCWDGARVAEVTHLGNPPPQSQIDSRPTNPPQVTLDPKRLEEDFLDVERARRFADQTLTAHPILDVSYEELCRDYQGVCRGVQHFLGVAPLALQPALEKLERRSLAQAIRNYQELKDRFSNTRWAAFFDE